MLQDQDCFPVIFSTLCNQTEAVREGFRPFVPILLAAAQRCAGFPPPATIPCPNGTNGTNGTVFQGLAAPASGGQ
eukprot:gene5359-5594_t